MVLYNIAFATSSNESYVNLLINLFFKSHGRLSQPMYKHLQYGRQPPPPSLGLVYSALIIMFGHIR